MGYPVFSRDEFLAAYNDFIALAVKMYLDESAYEWPPSTGWADMTIDSMRFFGKTDEVVELLRRLPYPKDGLASENRPQILPAMAFAAWNIDSRLYRDDESKAKDYLGDLEGWAIYEDVPATVVGLGERRRNDHGVLLDTKLGVIFWHDAFTEMKWFSPFPTVDVEDLLETPSGSDQGEEEDDDEYSMSEGESNRHDEKQREMSAGEREWRLCETVWTIPDFFATLKHMFTELHFVPMSKRRVVDGWYPPDRHGQDAVNMVKGIYRAHGWPDLDRYRKEECLEAVQAALSEGFPGYLSEDEEP